MCIDVTITRDVFEKNNQKVYIEKNSRNLFDTFCGPILGPIEGSRVKFKNERLGLKTNKFFFTQMRLNILGLTWEA
jgi:hypothetical protein